MDNYWTIDETDLFKLINIYEDTYLIDKQTKNKIFLGDFYGDPECGLISRNNDFCIVGGVDKCILYKDGKIITLLDEKLIPTHDIRQIHSSILLILTDPWSEKSAIWKLDIESMNITKQKDFTDYYDKEYTKNIIW